MEQLEQVESVGISINENINGDTAIKDEIIIDSISKICNAEDKTSYGKFKTSEALVNAYNSLEAEFTKRSQRLKELETKVVEEDKAEAPLTDTPLYQSEGWQQQVAEFVSKYPVAKEFAEEIASEIMNDDALAMDKHCLNLALNRVLAGKFRHPEQLIEDQDFLNDYIFSNNTIREKVVMDYLDRLNSSSTPDLIIKKGEISLSPPMKPRTLAEAGELATKILNRR